MSIKIDVGVIKAIDELLNINNQIEILNTRKGELSEGVKQFMETHGLDRVEGKKAQAIYITRETKEVDPEAYWELLGGDVGKLLSSVNVRIDPKQNKAGARSYIGEDDLFSISSVRETKALTIRKLATRAANATPPRIIIDPLPTPSLTKHRS